MSRLSDALSKAAREGTRREPLAVEGPRTISTIGDISALRFLESDTVTPDLDGCVAKLVSDEEPWVEQLRTFATRLRTMEGSDRVRKIGLMSAAGNEGKTTIAIALSLVLAEEPGDQILLIDADLRHRDVETRLGLKPSPGLGDWLKHPSPSIEVHKIGSDGPHFLSAGRPYAKPWELIASPHLGTLLDAASRDYRYVIADCPAEGPVADAAKIQEHLDGLLLIVRARSAPREAILATVDNLDEDKVLGVVFNAEFHSRKRFKYYRYSGYVQYAENNKTSR